MATVPIPYLISNAAIRRRSLLTAVRPRTSKRRCRPFIVAAFPQRWWLTRTGRSFRFSRSNSRAIATAIAIKYPNHCSSSQPLAWFARSTNSLTRCKNLSACRDSTLLLVFVPTEINPKNIWPKTTKTSFGMLGRPLKFLRSVTDSTFAAVAMTCSNSACVA